MPNDLVAQLAASHMGLPPTEEAAPQEQAAPPPPAPDKQTVAEQAIEQGSPKDEADTMDDDAITYEIDGRKLSPNQIRSTFERYRDLNFKNQEYADLHRVAEIASKLGHGNNPGEVAKAFAAMLKAQQSNPTMGGDSDRDDRRSNALPEDDELSRWEEENAAKLPPGYRELQSNLRDFGSGQQQLMEMMRAVIAQSGQTAGAAADTAINAKEQRHQLMQERIRHNLGSISQQAGLTGDHAQDFMIFAGERGYTLDDFIDPRLVASVMKDFKANMETPEMERLRSIAQRRQAYTGQLAASPTSGPAAAPAAGGDNSRLASMIDNVMQAKGR